MSELTPKDIKRFEQRLRERREELRSAIHDALIETNRNDFTALAGRVRDVGEDSVADLLVSMNLTMLDREVNELRDVEAALARIQEGTYGRCRDCGREIERERLEAYPTATRCIEDQQRYEASRAGGADLTPSL